MTGNKRRAGASSMPLDASPNSEQISKALDASPAAKPPAPPIDATQDLINVLCEHRDSAANSWARAEATARAFNREIERLKAELDKINAELAELRKSAAPPA